MKCKKTCFATARINGLTSSPYYFEHRCFFAWDIMFSDASITTFNHLLLIKVGDTEEEAVEFCNQLKENFKQAHIYNGEEVSIIFDKEDSHVSAIGCIDDQESWIDVDDKFVKKNLKELSILCRTKN